MQLIQAFYELPREYVLHMDLVVRQNIPINFFKRVGTYIVVERDGYLSFTAGCHRLSCPFRSGTTARRNDRLDDYGFIPFVGEYECVGLRSVIYLEISEIVYCFSNTTLSSF